MPFTVENFRDLVRILEAHPEWRAELRRLVLTDELLSLPEQLARRQVETERGFQQLAEAQRRTEDRLIRLEEAVIQQALQLRSRHRTPPRPTSPEPTPTPRVFSAICNCCCAASTKTDPAPVSTSSAG